MTSADGSETIPSTARRRRSALRALPFLVGFAVLTAAAALAGFAVHPLLALLLVPALWAPTLAELLFRTALPTALQVHYLVFVTAGPFAGSALGLYSALPDWDTLVHVDSGVLLAWVGLLFVRRAEERTGVLSPRWLALTVAAMTPMAGAAAWEICEFASDSLVGTTAQGGLYDTMTDMLAGTLGGLLTVAVVMIAPLPRSIVPASLARHPAA